MGRMGCKRKISFSYIPGYMCVLFLEHAERGGIIC